MRFRWRLRVSTSPGSRRPVHLPVSRSLARLASVPTSPTTQNPASLPTGRQPGPLPAGTHPRHLQYPSVDGGRATELLEAARIDPKKRETRLPYPSGRQPGPLPSALAEGTSSMRSIEGDSQGRYQTSLPTSARAGDPCPRIDDRALPCDSGHSGSSVWCPLMSADVRSCPLVPNDAASADFGGLPGE